MYRYFKKIVNTDHVSEWKFKCWLWCYSSWWYIRHSKLFNEKEWHSINKMLINKCSGSGNNINDSYAKLCIPDVVKNKYQGI